MDLALAPRFGWILAQRFRRSGTLPALALVIRLASDRVSNERTEVFTSPRRRGQFGRALWHVRNLIILFQSVAMGMPAAQVVDLQNASSGMWAFAEGNEVMFLVAFLYLLRPVIFNIAGRVVAVPASPNLR